MNTNKSVVKNNFGRKCDASLLPRKMPNASPVTKIKTDCFHKFKMPVTVNSVSSKCIKLHNCLPVESTSTIQITKTPNLKRKSISLIELPVNKKTYTSKKWHSKEHGDQTKTLMFTSTEVNVTFMSTKEEFKLARKVCKMFILRAWRRRRYEVTKLRINVQKLNNEVENIRIQNYALRSFLESEKVRVAVAMSDSAHLKQRLENELETANQLRKDLSHLETERCFQENLHLQLKAEISSLKTELSSAECINRGLKEELDACKFELNESRNKEAKLMSKLNAQEICLKDKISSLQTMNEKFIIQQNKIEQLISRNQTLSEEKEVGAKTIEKCFNKIRKLDVELNNTKNTRKLQNEDIVSLKKAICDAKDKIVEQEKVICDLTSTVNQYKLEKEEFQQRLIKMRNGAVFEVIKIVSNLFLPI